MVLHKTPFFLACILLSCYLVTGNIVKLRFPYSSENDKFPRVRIATHFSSLESFTLCQWVKPNFDGNRDMVMFSYGVPGQDKEISLSVNGSTLRLYVGGSLILHKACDGQKPINWMTGAWYHICVQYTDLYTRIRAFVNGLFCTRVLASESYKHTIPGNGVMVLGQALKGLDTDFHRNKSWNGDIAGVQMWDELLAYRQIVKLGRCEIELEGNVVSWMKNTMAASDEVIFSNANICGILKDGDDLVY